MAQITTNIPFPPEILELIFAYLVEKEPFSQFLEANMDVQDSRRDLLSCALSTRAFFDPAIRILWHTVDLMPLLKLLPDSIVKNGVFYAFWGEAGYDDGSLERFDIYSRKVRRLYLCDQDEQASKNAVFRIHESVFPRLSLFRPTPLPLLTHVHCSVKTFADRMGFMLSSSLKSVAFEGSDVLDVMLYLSLTKREAPMLQWLSIACQNNDETYLSLVSQSNNLRSFLPYVNNSREPVYLDIRALGGLEQLEDLVMDLRDADVLIPESDCILASPKSLKRLDLYMDHMSASSSAPATLELYKDSPLEALYMRGGFLDEQWRVLFKAISSQTQWTKTLTTLTIEADYSDWVVANEDDRELQPLSSFIEPLYALRRLEKLQLRDFADDYYATDADISRLCHAWPNLTNLVLHVSTDLMIPLPTVTSLRKLSEECLRLQVLELPIDVLKIPPINAPASSAVHPSPNAHRLDYLVLYVDEDIRESCDLGDGYAMLSYHLDALFPFLKTVLVNDNLHDPFDHQPWDAVNDVLESCQILRRTQ